MSLEQGHNPYRTPIDVESEATDAQGVPTSVAGVFLAGFLLIGLQFAELGYLIWRDQNYQLVVWLFPLLPSLLLFALMFSGKVAWACARYYFGFAFLIGSGLLLTSLISSMVNLFGISGLFLLGSLSCHLTLFYCLGLPESRKYYQMDCPQCGTDYPESLDWLSVKTRCRKCDHQW